MTESGSKIRLMAEGYGERHGGTDDGRIFRIGRAISISGALAEILMKLAF